MCALYRSYITAVYQRALNALEVGKFFRVRAISYIEIAFLYNRGEALISFILGAVIFGFLLGV